LAISLHLEDKLCILWSHYRLGEVARYQGDTARAAAHYAESLEIAQDLRYQSAIALILHRQGVVAHYQGDTARAQALQRESLALVRDLGQKWEIALCLEGLAEVAGTKGQPERATQLYGASEALREAMGAPLPPVEHANYERGIASVRTQLGESVFAEAWVAGRAMTLDQAIAYALAEGDLPPEQLADAR
jgi:hypothetical protein